MAALDHPDCLVNLQNLADQLLPLPDDKSVPIVFGKVVNMNFVLRVTSNT
jgi:hypothetical protein